MCYSSRKSHFSLVEISHKVIHFILILRWCLFFPDAKSLQSENHICTYLQEKRWTKGLQSVRRRGFVFLLLQKPLHNTHRTLLSLCLSSTTTTTIRYYLLHRPPATTTTNNNRQAPPPPVSCRKARHHRKP
ncbi:hypothetical protein Hanom_Chr14g01302161 [Helianthus anomalus]